MKERPILFNTAMVKAILEGRKTQTRRVLKSELIIRQAEFERGNRPHIIRSEPNLQYWIENSCPLGQVGDHLWVRETFRFYDSDECPHADFPCGCPRHGTPLFKASHDCGDGEKWTPSIHMPRWASRILLEITKIRVECLNDISEEDSIAEGVESVDSERDVHDFSICSKCGGTRSHGALGHNLGWIEVECRECDTHKKRFESLWESINGEDSWDVDPWVWIIEFRVIQGGEA